MTNGDGLILPRDCDPEENIVRAIQESHWDFNNGRYSSKLFGAKKGNTSIACLKSSTIPQLFKKFIAHLDKPKHSVVGGAEINVADLQSICLRYKVTNKIKPAVSVRVIHDGDAFDEHGLIIEPISRRLALDIANKYVKVHYARRYVTLRLLIRRFYNKLPFGTLPF